MDDNKDVQLLKDKIWTRQVATEAEVIVIKRNQVGEKPHYWAKYGKIRQRSKMYKRNWKKMMDKHRKTTE